MLRRFGAGLRTSVERRMRSKLGAVCGAALSALASLSVAQQAPQPARPAAPAPRATVPADAPGRDAAVRGSFGAWQVRCETMPGAQNEICALYQTVEAADRPNTGLAVFAFRTADQRSNVMRIIAPLGVLLTGGLGLRIDDQNIGSTDFVRCWPTGCIAEARLSDELLGRLRNGRTATFIVFMTPEEGVGIPVSLEGFAQGFDAVTGGQPAQAAPAAPAQPPAQAAPPAQAPAPPAQPPRR
jgi:invasion protein IalB